MGKGSMGTRGFFREKRVMSPMFTVVKLLS